VTDGARVTALGRSSRGQLAARDWRYAAGVTPVQRLNARWSARTSANPTAYEISAIVRVDSASWRIEIWQRTSSSRACIVTLIDEELAKANQRIQAGTPKAAYYKTWVLGKGLTKVESPAPAPAPPSGNAP
jgi:hypothetical protein